MNDDIVSHVIKRLLHEGCDSDTHICFDGRVVPFGSDECLADMYQRKRDAERIRNGCPTRSDKRDYYNGVLKVLRREIRKAEKLNARQHDV